MYGKAGQHLLKPAEQAKSQASTLVYSNDPAEVATMKMMNELKRLGDSEALPRDHTGILALEWYTNHINVRKPVKKFVNLNDQTKFAKLQPSLLAKQTV